MAIGVVLPPLPRRRRSELGLCAVGALVVAVALGLLSIERTNHLPASWWQVPVAMAAIIGALQWANRRYAPGADPILVPVALFLNGIGYVMIDRENEANTASHQLAWTFVGVLVYVVVLAGVRASRDLERYRYLLAAVALVLLLLPLVPHLSSADNNAYGARLWIGFGPISFQPVEVSKILLVIFFASYFIEKRELLTVPTRRIGNHLVPDLRALGPVLIAAAVALVVILGEHDIGFSLILFSVFLTLLWVTTGRASYLAIGAVLFVAGAFLASHLLVQVNDRMVAWLDPWKHPLGVGFQPVQSELAFGRGGLFGSGIGLGLSGNSGIVPVNSSDFIFAVIGEELGLVGTAGLLVGYVLMIGAGIRAALRARSEFAKLCAVGLVATLAFQTFFIMAGDVLLLPLTGVTLPFVSAGGSSLVTNYALVALLMRISDEGNRPYRDPIPISSRTSLAAVIAGRGRWRSASASASEGRHSSTS